MFVTISIRILLVRNVSNGTCKKKSKCTFYTQLVSSENYNIYEINLEKYGGAKEIADAIMVARCFLV
jgi:hypothetical protein